MPGRGFLDVSRDAVAGPTEYHWRAAIIYAYYALLLECLFTGCGGRRGSVLGASDKIGGYPKEHPVSPKDVLCTIYHLLGLGPHLHIPDREGRPLPLVHGGSVLVGMFA